VLEINPEPTPDERKAIEQALAALAEPNGRPPADGRGAWWRRGVREAVEDEDDPENGRS
jgi:hypothetical protein